MFLLSIKSSLRTMARAMEPFSYRVTGLPDQFPIQQIDRLVCEAVFLGLFKKTTQLIVEWGTDLASFN